MDNQISTASSSATPTNSAVISTESAVISTESAVVTPESGTLVQSSEDGILKGINDNGVMLGKIHFDLMLIILIILAIYVYSVFRKAFLRIKGKK